MSSSGEDIEPARQLAADSRQALATHWVKAQPVVAAFIASIVRDSHRADDLLQEVARISAVKFDEYDSSRAFTSWVLGIARYEILRFRRSQGRSRIMFSDSLLGESYRRLSGSKRTQRRPPTRATRLSRWHIRSPTYCSRNAISARFAAARYRGTVGDYVERRAAPVASHASDSGRLH